MGRKRRPISLDLAKGKKHFEVVFYHPLEKKTTRLNLGPNHARAKLLVDGLNVIFQNPHLWRSPPADLAPDVLRLWGAPAAETWRAFQGENGGFYASVEEWDEKLAADGKQKSLEQRVAELEEENQRLRDENRRIRFTYERALERKLPGGGLPTLGQALRTWLPVYQARRELDTDHRKNVGYDLRGFVSEFGESTKLEVLDFVKISEWIAKKSASRRRDLRTYITKFLRESGLPFEAINHHEAGPALLESIEQAGQARWSLEPEVPAAQLEALKHPAQDRPQTHLERTAYTWLKAVRQFQGKRGFARAWRAVDRDQRARAKDQVRVILCGQGGLDRPRKIAGTQALLVRH